MNEKITVQDIIDFLIEKHSMDPQDADSFVKGMFELIEEVLLTDNYVKVRGLGTFKLTGVESRESVNISTGERIEIQGHTKVTFTPDSVMKDLINKPFAHFETVALNENTRLEDLETPIGDEEEEATEEPIATDVVLPVVREEEPNVSVTDIQEDERTTTKETMTVQEPVAKKPAKRFPWGILIAVVLLLMCVAGGLIYGYQQTGKEAPQPVPADTVSQQTVPMDTIPQVPVQDTLVQEVFPVAKPVAEIPKRETLADTVEYDITGTKTSHTLQEGESLVKLSVRFYGTKKLWPYIVKHNQNIIKDADKVPVGTTLRIPELTPKK